MKIMSRQCPLILLVLFIGACVTVNIYFPAAKVEKAAEQIVDDVYGPSHDQQSPSEPQTMLDVFLAMVGPAPAFAQDATSVSNAAIRGLKEQIRQHHSQLSPYYDKGAVGITNRGYLELRDTQGLSVAELGKLKRLVAADNDARSQLYKEVARALNVDPSQTSKVEDIFAQKWQDGAKSGWQIQGSDGQWRSK